MPALRSRSRSRLAVTVAMLWKLSRRGGMIRAMGLGARIRSWLEVRRRDRLARRLVVEAFRSPELLRGTSLGPRHASRWVLLEHEWKEGRPARIRFGIVRHPRPYAFSRQSHQVLEVWLYDLEAGRLERERGRNLTRERGEDAG